MDRNKIECDCGVETLCAAIVERAVIDYRQACRGYLKGKLTAHDTLNILVPIRRFLGSAWYDELTNVNPDLIINQLDSEFDFRALRRVARKIAKKKEKENGKKKSMGV